MMSPLGIAVGIGVMEAKLESGALIQAILEGLAAGTFIYITFLEILPHELNSPERQLLKVLFILLGFSVMAGLTFLGWERLKRRPHAGVAILHVMEELECFVPCTAASTSLRKNVSQKNTLFSLCHRNEVHCHIVISKSNEFFMWEVCNHSSWCFITFDILLIFNFLISQRTRLTLYIIVLYFKRTL